jgi:hypothetical protein
LYAMKYTRAISSKIAIMAAGEENNQWCDWKGLLRDSNRCNSSLASKVPEIVEKFIIKITKFI